MLAYQEVESPLCSSGRDGRYHPGMAGLMNPAACSLSRCTLVNALCSEALITRTPRSCMDFRMAKERASFWWAVAMAFGRLCQITVLLKLKLHIQVLLQFTAKVS